jgi:hypothetical protein
MPEEKRTLIVKEPPPDPPPAGYDPNGKFCVFWKSDTMRGAFGYFATMADAVAFANEILHTGGIYQTAAYEGTEEEFATIKTADSIEGRKAGA